MKALLTNLAADVTAAPIWRAAAIEALGDTGGRDGDSGRAGRVVSCQAP